MEKKRGAVGSVSGFVTSGIEDALSAGICVSSWVFGPASTVLQCSIISVFPPMNGAQDEAYKVLHTTYLSRLPSLHTKSSIAVMWTNLVSILYTETFRAVGHSSFNSSTAIKSAD